MLDIDRGTELSNRESFSNEKLMGYAALLMSNQEFNLAVPVLRRALQISSHNLDAIEWLGRCLLELGSLLEAKKVFSELTRLSPTANAFVSLGNVLYLLEEDSKAQVAYQRAMELNCQDSKLLFEIFKNLGNISTRSANFDEAEDYFNKAYRIDPQSDILQVNYGTLAIQRDDLDSALQYFRQAVDLNSSNDRAWVGLALVHRQKGDFTLSWGNLRKALDIQPKNRTAVRLLCDWAVQDQKIQEVLESVYNYCHLATDDTEMVFKLATLLILTNRLADARWQLERILAMDPEYPQAQDLLTEVMRSIHV